nr:hypothetical protein [Tanacetum cinerariifolium]
MCWKCVNLVRNQWNEEGCKCVDVPKAQESKRDGSWNIRGMSTSTKQKEVQNFITKERLHVCAVLETHLNIYTSTFIKKAWNVVGDEVCLAVKEFLDTGKLLGEVNATLITLIPKVTNPTKKMCAMKIDVQNAYDIVNWDFLSRKGPRQADPIFPYLFTLVIHKNVLESHSLKYHQGCKDMKLAYLCFVVDLLVLCHGDNGSVEVVKKSLDDFSQVSGLHPNMNKSTIFFRILNECERARILNIMPFAMGKLPMKYLGVTILSQRLSITNCQVLLDNIKRKVQDWKTKVLSYVDRVHLIALFSRPCKGAYKKSATNLLMLAEYFTQTIQSEVETQQKSTNPISSLTRTPYQVYTTSPWKLN